MQSPSKRSLTLQHYSVRIWHNLLFTVHYRWTQMHPENVIWCLTCYDPQSWSNDTWSRLEKHTGLQQGKECVWFHQLSSLSSLTQELLVSYLKSGQCHQLLSGFRAIGLEWSDVFELRVNLAWLHMLFPDWLGILLGYLTIAWMVWMVHSCSHSCSWSFLPAPRAKDRTHSN